jgi:hypothetical protein
MKRPKHYTATAHGVTVTSTRSTTDAKDMLSATLDGNHSNGYSPYLCTFRNLIGLAWREPNTSAYDVAPIEQWWMHVTETDGRDFTWRGSTSLTCGQVDRSATTQSLRYHMAMRAWDGTADDIEACAAFLESEGLTLDRYSPGAFSTWCESILQFYATAAQS